MQRSISTTRSFSVTFSAPVLDHNPANPEEPYSSALRIHNPGCGIYNQDVSINSGTATNTVSSAGGGTYEVWALYHTLGGPEVADVYFGGTLIDHQESNCCGGQNCEPTGCAVSKHVGDYTFYTDFTFDAVYDSLQQFTLQPLTLGTSLVPCETGAVWHPPTDNIDLTITSGGEYGQLRFGSSGADTVHCAVRIRREHGRACGGEQLVHIGVGGESRWN